MDKKLSICMIVKDEEKNLRRCLESLIPLLKKGYTELIIVDTGSTDNTQEIAREFTEYVYFHEWNGNFSDMRNISISYAKGQWIFIVDADEELETPDELIDLLESEKINNFNTIRIKERNLLSKKLNKYVYHVQERLFKNNGIFQYKGTIHNQPIYQHPVLIVDNIWLMHYGYINEDKDLMEKKFQRTANMLKKELNQDPENVYYRFQLARSYMMHGDSVLAIEEITKAYESMKQQDSRLIIYRYYVFGEFARMALHTKKYEKVIDICKEGIFYNDHYLDLYYYMGHAYLELEEYEKGLNKLNKYIELHGQYYKNELDLSNFTAVEMYTLDKDTFEKTIDRIISLVYSEPEIIYDLNKYKQVLNDIENKALRAKLLTKVFMLEENYDQLLGLYKNIEDAQRYHFINYLEMLKKGLDGDHAEQFEQIFSTIEDDYGLLNKIRINENRNKLLLEFTNKYDIIKFSDEVIIEFIKYLIKDNYLNRFFKKIDSLTIKKIVKVLIDREDKLEYFLNSLRNDYKYNDFHNNRIFISITNVILLSILENQKGQNFTTELNELFLDYIKRGIDYISNLYNVKHLRIFYNTLDNREEKFFILMLFAYENSDKGNYTSFARYAKDAAITYPYLSKMLPVAFYDVYLKKAKEHETKGEYLWALETYEDILNLKISNNFEVKESIKRLELMYKEEIKNQLKLYLKNRNRENDYQYENVHLIIDSPYSEDFIKFVNENFDDKLHIFLLLTENGSTKYVNPVGKNNLYIFSIKDKDKLSNILSVSKKIFIHYLLDFFCDLISETNLQGIISWVVWGGDLYNHIDYDLYDPETIEFLKSNGILPQKPKGIFNLKRRKAIRKTDFILTFLKNDYDLIVKNYITIAKLKKFQYPLSINKSNTPDEIIKVLNGKQKNVTLMLGNSGDPTNNHIEILEKIKKFSNEEFKLIVPLSYGNPKYIQKLIQRGYELLGDRFVPITEFLSEENYIELLNGVDVAFMNHNRQQGLGNIFLLLSLNKKIYLKSNSSVMDYLREQHYSIFNIDELDSIEFNEIIRYEDSILNNQQNLFNKISNKIIKKTISNVFKDE